MDQHRIGALLAAATAARRAGNADQAARLYGQIIAGGAEHPAALNALGLQALAARDLPGAATLFRRAVAADPAAADLGMNLAKALRDQGDDAGERAALEGVLAIDRTHFMALVRMAELLDRQGEGTAAVEHWTGVVAIGSAAQERTPGLEMLLEHARARVAQGRAAYAAAIDTGMAPARAKLAADERRRVDACIDHLLGRRQIYANEPHGLHMPFLPADEFFPRAHFPWLSRIEAEAAAIRAEAEALLADPVDAGLTPYVTMPSGTPDNKWSPLNNNRAWSALHLWKDGRRNDAACARAPRTAAAVEALPLSDLPGRTPTVFFSVLQPGAHLPPHTGVSNVRTIIHLPLIVPPDCGFRVGGETRPWVEGEAFAFDDTIEHEAWNRSDRPRAVLIFDVWNPHITAPERELLREYYRVSDASGMDAGKANEVSD